jgi:hypothetical protein
MKKYQARMLAASRNAQQRMSIMELAEAPFVQLIPCEDGISRLAPSVAALKKSCMNGSGGPVWMVRWERDRRETFRYPDLRQTI